MGVLSPWNRKKAAEQEEVHQLPPPPATLGANKGRLAARALAALGLVAALLFAWSAARTPPLSAGTVWELEGARLLAHLSGYYLVLHDGKVLLMDSSSATGSQVSSRVSETGSLEDQILTVSERGLVRLLAASASERVLPPARGGFVLTQKPSMDGQFGETWNLTAYSLDGRRQWTGTIMGTAYCYCIRNNALAVAVVDLSSGGAPSILVMDAATGNAIWSRSLPGGAFRALGFLDDGTLAVVLSTGVSAFAPDGAIRWTHSPVGAISAAVVAGDTICLSRTVNPGVRKLVYPYEVVGLDTDGSLRWSFSVRREILSMQEWIGKEAIAGFAENHVLGFKIRDGERVSAERTGASPVSLHGDTLLIRDNRGLRLVRLREIERPAP